MLWGDDIQALELVFKTAAHRSLALGEWPHWMPEILSGMPGIAASNLVFLHPIELFFCLLGLPPWMGFGLDAAAEVALSGIGTFLLLRRLGASRSAALLAGLLFASSGTQISLLRAGHINNIKGIAMIPWVFWGAHKAMSEKSWLGWALAGAALALQVLGLGLQIFAYTIIGLAAFAFWMAWVPSDDEAPAVRWRTAILGLGVAALFATLLSAPQLLTSLQYKPYSWREGFSYEQFVSWSFHPKEALGWIVPGFYGWLSPTYHGDWAFCLTTEYFGLLPWALAAAALAAAWSAGSKHRVEWFFSGLAVFSFLAGIGKYFPLHHLFFHLPIYSGFRTWTRFLCLMTFSVCVLGGLGWDALFAERSPQARKAALYFSLFAAFASIVALQVANFTPEQQAIARSSAGKAVGLSLALAALFWTWTQWSKQAALVLLAVVAFHAFDMSEMVGRYLIFRSPQEVLAAPPAFSVLPDGQHGEAYRVLDLPGLWPQNTPALNGIEMLQGYHGVQMAAPQALTKALGGRQLDWLNLMNVRYIFSPQAQPVPGWKLLQAGPPVFTYENPSALPRAFLVANALAVKDDDAAFAALAQPSFPVLQAVTVPEDPALGQGPLKGGARISVRGRNRLELEAVNDRAALLVVSQTWYPAWKALVNGKPSPVLKADGGALQALRLDPGQHHIELYFSTDFFHLTAALCFLGLGLLAWLWRRERAV